MAKRPRQPHEKTELEFAAKRVNDVLREQFPDENLQFLSFIAEAGSGGYLGYIGSARRIDAIRLIGEWLIRVTGSLSESQWREMLLELKKEHDAARSMRAAAGDFSDTEN